MSDRTQSTPPPEIAGVLAKQPQAMTQADLDLLTRWLLTSGSQNPLWADVVGSILLSRGGVHNAPMPSYQPPPVADQVNAPRGLMDPSAGGGTDWAEVARGMSPTLPGGSAQTGGFFGGSLPSRPGAVTPDIVSAPTLTGTTATGPTPTQSAGGNGPLGMPGLSDADLGVYGQRSPDPNVPMGRPPVVGPAPSAAPPSTSGSFLPGHGRSIRDVNPLPAGVDAVINSTQASMPPVFEPKEKRDRKGGRRGGGGEDWKGILASFGEDPNSPFFGLNTSGSELAANNPAMAAYLMAKGNPQVASMIYPQVEQAMNLADYGVIGGGQGGIADPRSNAAKLAQVESLLGSIGPGDYIDPRRAYKRVLRRTQRTPLEQFKTSYESPGGSPQEQIDVTNTAVMSSVGASMPDFGRSGLKAQLDRAAMDWLVAVSKGETMSYPQYLRSIHAGRWVGKSIV